MLVSFGSCKLSIIKRYLCYACSRKEEVSLSACVRIIQVKFACMLVMFSSPKINRLLVIRSFLLSKYSSSHD